MEQHVIDQTESERELNRAFFLLKYLRSLPLHLILSGLAAFSYFSVSLHAYPVSTAVFQALRALAFDTRLQYGTTGIVTFWIVLTLVLFGLLAITAWMYRSVVDHRKTSLRILSAGFAMLATWSCLSSLPALRFTTKHLDPLFAVWAVLSVLFLHGYVQGSFSFILLRLSRLQESSSLTATLDPKLSPNTWVFVNRLLDLPRTPFQSAWTGLSYLLSVG